MIETETLDMGALKAQVKQARAAALEELRAHRIDGPTFAGRLSDITDRALRQILEHVFGEIGGEITAFYGGGNGRQEVCPGSDLDIAFVISDKLAADEKRLKLYSGPFGAIMLAMEDCGFPPDSSFRYCTVTQHRAVADEKDDARTNLLELRRLWGSKKLFAELEEMSDEFHRENPVAFVNTRLELRSKRLALEKNAPHLREPDIKEGYGGLRDYDMLLWMGKALKGKDNCSKVEDLVMHGFMTDAEAHKLKSAHDFMLTLRCHLHDLLIEKNQKQKNILHFHWQQDLAQRFPTLRTPEALMREYYRAARTIGFLANVTCAAIAERVHVEYLTERRKTGISRFVRSLNAVTFGALESLIDRRLEMKEDEAGFLVSEKYIRFKNGAITNPLDMFNIYRSAQKHGVELHHKALRMIHDNLHLIDDRFRHDDTANALFWNILDHEKGESSFRQMQELGLSQVFDPRFAGIDSHVLFDLNHACTVDEHTNRVLGNLWKLLNGKHDREKFFAMKYVAGLSESDRKVLFAAAYFHDICKPGEKGRGLVHHLDGAALVREIGTRRGLTPEETEKVGWLVEHHLDLWHMSDSMDHAQAQTGEALKQIIPTSDHLILLAILSTADAMSTSPKGWTSYRNMQMQSLCAATFPNIFENELKHEQRLEAPENYTPGETVVSIREDFKLAANVLKVAVPDHPFLFENLVGALGTEGCEIIDGRARKLEDGTTIVNSIAFRGRGGAVIKPENAVSMLKRIEVAAKAGTRIDYEKKVDAARVSYDPASKVLKVEPEVECANDVSGNSTFVKVTGKDRPGFLYDLARTFNDLGLGIVSLKLETRGHKAVDAFYVQTRDGQKLPEWHFNALRDALAQATIKYRQIPALG